mmetsp:Transcript_37927/g.88256  ORF Transcript_37927/g.88256 Transcript_37927/m.88256 type:complete len:220 (-) Transcript_37927:531-1190(-)
MHFTDLDVSNRSCNVAHFARLQYINWNLMGNHYSYFCDIILRSACHKSDLVTLLKLSVDHAKEHNDTTILIVHTIKNQGFERHGFSVPVGCLGRRYFLHDPLHNIVDPDPALRTGLYDVGAVQPDRVLDLLRHSLRLRRRQIDLVQHGNALQIVLQGQVDVRHRLRLDSLTGVHHQQRPLARREAAAHLVRKVHVSGGVDQIQRVHDAVAGAVEHSRGL